MEPYLFYGVVRPERAQLTLSLELSFTHLSTGRPGKARVSVILNQAVVWVETEDAWDVFDLRNVVKGIIQTDLAMIGYLKGFAYDFEVTRVLNQSLGVDYVFGVDIPCIAKRGETIDLGVELSRLREKASGPHGVFLHRCFNDLASSMKHPDDTGFYCYRAVESLRHHCAAIHALSEADKATQWAKVRQVSGVEESVLRTIQSSADALRHGGIAQTSSEDRTTIFTLTWNVVDAYLRGI